MHLPTKNGQKAVHLLISCFTLNQSKPFSIQTHSLWMVSWMLDVPLHREAKFQLVWPPFCWWKEADYNYAHFLVKSIDLNDDAFHISILTWLFVVVSPNFWIFLKNWLTFLNVSLYKVCSVYYFLIYCATVKITIQNIIFVKFAIFTTFDCHEWEAFHVRRLTK